MPSARKKGLQLFQQIFFVIFNALQLCKRDADRSVCQQPLAVRDLDTVTKKQELRSGNIQFFYHTLFHFSSPLSEKRSKTFLWI